MANSRYEMPLPGNPRSCLQECQGVVVRFGGLLTVLTASVDIDILMVNWHGTICHHLVIHSIFVFPYRVMPKTYSQNITCKIFIKKKSFSSRNDYTEGSDSASEKCGRIPSVL